MSSDTQSQTSNDSDFIPVGKYNPHRGKWVEFKATEESEPVQKYIPNQMDFHLDRWKSDFRGVFTGYGGGKTTTGVAEMLYWAFAIPEMIGGATFGWMGEPTFPMVEDVLVPTLESKTFLGCPIDESEWVRRCKRAPYLRRIEWINGSVTSVGSTENPNRIEGGNWDYYYLDEGAGVREFKTAWRILASRLRGSGLLKRPVPAKGWTTSLPLPRGTSLWDYFANPMTKDPFAREFHWAQMDNMALTRQYLRGQEALHLTEADITMYRKGEWLDIGVGSYRYDYRTHYFDNYRLLPPRDQWIRVGYGLDFGWDHFTAFEVAVFDSFGRAWFVDEFYETELEQDDIRKRIQILQQRWEPEAYKTRSCQPVWCDHEKRTISHLRKYNIDARKAKKTTEARSAGIRDMGGRFHLRKDGLPGIFINKKCGGMLREVVVYDTKKKVNDDAMDAGRYLVFHNHPDNVGTFGSIQTGKTGKADPRDSYKIRKVA